jgi:hypothetical protein
VGVLPGIRSPDWEGYSVVVYHLSTTTIKKLFFLPSSGRDIISHGI